MGKATEQSGGSGAGRRALLLGVWVLLSLAWCFLIFQVPILFTQYRADFLLKRDSGTATLALANQDVFAPWSQEINFDVSSGSLDWGMSRELDDLFLKSGTDPNRDRHRILIVDQRPSNSSYRLVPPQGSGVPQRDFQFPQYPYQVNDRFAVTVDAGNLFVMAFDDEKSATKTTSVGGFPVSVDIKPIEGVDAFLRFQDLPNVGNPPAYQVQHFTIDEDLAAVPGVIWQMLNISPFAYQCVANSGDHVVSINPTNYEIEFRHSANGKLIESKPFPVGMNPAAMPCSFWANHLRIEPTPGAPRFLDLKNRKWLPLIEGGNFGPGNALGEKFILFRKFDGTPRLRCKVFDIEQQKVISSFETNVYADFIDEESVLDVGSEAGLTFRKIDLQTGELVQTWRPFRWVIPLTSFLCVGWLIWSWRWLVGSRRRSGAVSIWLDVALIALLPIVLCMVRLRYIGYIHDLSRVPTQIAQAIILALLLSGVVWLVHLKVRIVPRILPFILATAVLAAAVSVTYSGQLSYVVPGAIKAMVPVSVYFVCFLVLRVVGYRLLPPDSSEAVEQIEKANFVTIRDMFVLMAVLAVLFAGLSPWLPSFRYIFQSLSQVPQELAQFALLSLAPVLAWWLAMSGKRSRLVGDLLFLAMFGFLIASSAYRFTGNSSLIYSLFNVFPTMDALPATCFVATYWIAMCFRLHGWKFRRTLSVA